MIHKDTVTFTQALQWCKLLTNQPFKRKIKDTVDAVDFTKKQKLLPQKYSLHSCQNVEVYFSFV